MPIAPDALAPIERRTTVERVERRLRDEILRGGFTPGEKLPPERELAGLLGVTRVTLRSALARLAASGLLSTVQGDGHRVRDVRVHGGLERLPDMAAAFEGDVARVTSLVSDLLALRRLVMAEAAAACALADDDAVAELARLVQAMEAQADDRDAFAAIDLDFGRAMLRIGGNLAYELTYNTMIALAQGHPELMDVLYAEPESILRGARALLVLLALRDAELARGAVRDALEALDSERLAQIRARLEERARP